jgi:putative membrane protein
MRIATLTTVAALALAAAACSGNTEAGNDISTDANLAQDAAANDVLGANAMTDNEAATAMPTDANGFATAVAASDMYEIESSRLAATKSNSTEVKELAGHLITDHQKSTAELKTAASQAKVAVTPALDAEKQAMLDQLKAASGADFDRLYLEQQKTAHQKALGLLQSFAQGGDAAPLKAFARKATGVIEGHIEHLNGIRQPS